ncbi:MAG TPA: hypothetical protein VF993_00100, partial [Myxococcales bacterium]
MHPRLRRQMQAAKGDALLDAVSSAYNEADESIRSLTAMLQKAQEDQRDFEERRELRRKRAARAARKLQRAMARSGLPLFELTAELVV